MLSVLLNTKNIETLKDNNSLMGITGQLSGVYETLIKHELEKTL